jgi:AraC-like DNA-binding protein
MDILDDILNTLDLSGALYFRTDFSPPWSVTVPVLSGAARFHLVVQGQCTVTLPDKRVWVLNPGDLILIPHGQTHILSDAPVEQAPPLETVLEKVQYDGSGVLRVGTGDATASTQLVCGHFTFREKAGHAMLRAMPDQLIVTAAMRAENSWLDDVLRLISRHMFSDRAGLDASVRRLSEVMFIELMRIGIESEEQGQLQHALKGFRDPQIGQALAIIHKDLQKPWTVGSLAREVGMSRSSFAERFADLMGQGPMSYLTDWRLQKALALLGTNKINVQQIATETGYQSPAAFTRAFAAKFGETPTRYRQIHL